MRSPLISTNAHREQGYLLPLTSYLCLTKFAYAKRYPLGQRGEPPQRNFALLPTPYLPVSLHHLIKMQDLLVPLFLLCLIIAAAIYFSHQK